MGFLMTEGEQFHKNITTIHHLSFTTSPLCLSYSPVWTCPSSSHWHYVVSGRSANKGLLLYAKVLFHKSLSHNFVPWLHTTTCAQCSIRTQANDTPKLFTAICQGYMLFSPPSSSSFFYFILLLNFFLPAPVPGLDFLSCFPFVWHYMILTFDLAYIAGNFFLKVMFCRTTDSSFSPLSPNFWSWFFWPAN